MATRGNILDLMDVDEVFKKYVDNTDFRNADKFGEILTWSIKNTILEGRLDKLVGDVEDLQAKVDITGERK